MTYFYIIDETVDVQGFGDYDYGDDEDYDDEGFGDEYEGDFTGDNLLSNNIGPEDESDEVKRRNFNVETSNENIGHRYFVDESSFNPDSNQNHRIPKQVQYPEKFETLQAPQLESRFKFKYGGSKSNQNGKIYPDVIALVDDQYIRDTRPRRKIRPHRRPVLKRG